MYIYCIERLDNWTTGRQVTSSAKGNVKLLNLMFQKIRNSKDKQREFENEQVRTLDKLNNARTSRIEEIPSLQVGTDLPTSCHIRKLRP